MFEERYRKANDSVHVGDALLTRISDAQTQPNGRALKWVLASGGALASVSAVILIAVLLGGTDASILQPRTDVASMAAEMPAEENAAVYDAAAAEAYDESASEETLCSTASCDSGESCGEIGCGGADISDLYGQSHAAGHVGSASIHNGIAYFLSADGQSVQIVSKAEPDVPPETLLLGGYANGILVSDTLLLACRSNNDDAASTVLEAYLMSDRTLLWQYNTEGSLLDAFCYQNTVYLLLSAENGLRVIAMNGFDPNDWTVSYDAGAYWGSASLWPVDDGVMLVYQTASGSDLMLLMNEPDGLSIDAQASLEFNVLYAHATASGWYVIAKDTDGLLAAYRLTSLLEREGEPISVGSGFPVADGERVLVLSYGTDNGWTFFDGALSGAGYVRSAQQSFDIDGSFDPICLDAASDSLLLQRGDGYYWMSVLDDASVPVLIEY